MSPPLPSQFPYLGINPNPETDSAPRGLPKRLDSDSGNSQSVFPNWLGEALLALPTFTRITEVTGRLWSNSPILFSSEPAVRVERNMSAREVQQVCGITGSATNASRRQQYFSCAQEQRGHGDLSLARGILFYLKNTSTEPQPWYVTAILPFNYDRAADSAYQDSIGDGNAYSVLEFWNWGENFSDEDIAGAPHDLLAFYSMQMFLGPLWGYAGALCFSHVRRELASTERTPVTLVRLDL